MMITREQGELWLAVSKDKDQFAGLLPLYSRKYTDILHFLHFNYDMTVVLILRTNQDIKDAVGTLRQMNDELPTFMRMKPRYEHQMGIEFENGSRVRGFLRARSCRGMSINYMGIAEDTPEEIRDELAYELYPCLVATGAIVVEF